MSYQQYLQSTAKPTPNPNSAAPTFHRKPVSSSLRSVSPIAGSTSAPTPRTQEYSPISPLPAQSLKSSNDSISGPLSPHPSNSVPKEPAALAQKLKPLTQQEIDHSLQQCLNVQRTAVSEHGKRPFAALLLGPDNSTVLATHFSISHFQHAESELARLVGLQYSQSWLANCTLVSTWEPCAMCSGTIYWAGIGRVLYAAAETQLKELTGAGNTENMTMSLPCRTVLNAGQRIVEVVGPVGEWQEKVVQESGLWWEQHQDVMIPVKNGHVEKTENLPQHTISVYNPENSVLGSVDEEGEYQADLKIDWMP